ncbi:MAG TPA: DUF434 domain-containing protein [Candidatus Angelobacter sp.]|nr:DUF434 domain-containing protein [Candidatus Angelobacter sp.]
MPVQAHRGAASEDFRLFAVDQLPVLRIAAADFCWLLDRDYAPRSALEVVGNRYSLAVRQRMAISRYACSENEARRRRERTIELAQLRGRELWVDGYNVLTLIESALSGGVVLWGRDGCCRDIAGIHRRYRKVSETIPALQLVGETIAASGAAGCRWWLDKPVSNSGRLKAAIIEIAKTNRWNCEVEVVFSPDRELSHTNNPIATSDGIVLDRCRSWVNLARHIIAERIPGARVVDLGNG